MLRLLPPGREFGRAAEQAFVHVAERYDFDRRDLDQPPEVALAVPPGAHEPDPIGLLLGGPGHMNPECRQGQPGSRLEKLTSSHGKSPETLRIFP